jgi:hypothetical protein
METLSKTKQPKKNVIENSLSPIQKYNLVEKEKR